MSRRITLAVLTGLVIACVAATNGFTQAPGQDPDECPDVQGTASGCPDQDLDGIADSADPCPIETSREGTDSDGNGCHEPITSVSYRFRLTRRPGVRLTSLRLAIITRGSVTAGWSCRGGGCRGRVRRRGNTIRFAVSRRRLRPGTVIRIRTRNSAIDAITECFRLRVRRRGLSVRARRAITLGVPSVSC
jgi:hypothetical protein